MSKKLAFARNRELGAELQKLRKAAGLRGQDLEDRTGWDHTTISRIETGFAGITLVDLMQYLGACGVYLREAKEMMALCEDAERQLGYWLTPQGEWADGDLSSLIFHESTAHEVVCYDPMMINGLLQTAGYAHALMSRYNRDHSEVERGVRARLARQRILNRKRPSRFTFFVHEQALRFEAGSDSVNHEQLLQLVFLTALPHVTVRVVPAPEMFGGAFHLFGYERHQPLVFLADYSCGVFLEDKEFVTPYLGLIPRIEQVALDEGQSREFVASLANGYDRERPKRHAAIYELEEEQP